MNLVFKLFFLFQFWLINPLWVSSYNNFSYNSGNDLKTSRLSSMFARLNNYDLSSNLTELNKADVFSKNGALYKFDKDKKFFIQYGDDGYPTGKAYDLNNSEVNVDKNTIGKIEVVASGGVVFNHVPTSGAIITNNAKQGTFLVGSYPSDLQYILGELNYPKIQTVDFNFPVPNGQKFNLLNISDEAYNYWAANGGFFTKVNGPWIDAAVKQGADIIVVSKMETLYYSPGVLSGFGKEIHRLEWKHGYRYNPNTKTMVPPSQANGFPAKTLQSEYSHN